MENKGFTLIELMIAVAIIGFLAAIAYPSYLEFTKKTRRAEGAATVMEAMQVTERHFSQTGVYAGAPIPDRSPQSGSQVYNIELADGDAKDGGYLITATAVNGSLLEGDDCAVISINALGLREPNDPKCWRE